MKIGTVKIENTVFLAPMAGVTDMPFRILCKEQGCGLVYTEMVSAKGMYYNDEKSFKLTEINQNEMPACIQIFGSSPKIMAGIADRLNASNASILDINMGCPTPKITKNGEGSALMLHPVLVGEIVKEVVHASEKPVTVKIRKGWDDSFVNAVEIAKIVEQNGADAIAVHGRTREQFYSGKADLNIIKEVKEAVKIPVIGNGDIFKPQDAKRMFLETACDAVMVGRGAEGNPWIFSSILRFLETGEILREPSAKEKIETVIRHMNMLIGLKGQRTGILEMRSHIAWYVKGMKNAAEIREKIFRMTDADEIVKLLQGFMLEAT